MSSIVSSLGEEKEWRLRGLFPRPVRLHLLYKSSHHGADISTLLSSFDSCGSFVLAVFLQSGEVRGGFTSKSLKNGSEFIDEEAFLFEINNNARRFPVNKPARAVQVHFTESAPSSSFTFGSTARSGSSFGLSPGLTSPSSFSTCLVSSSPSTSCSTGFGYFPPSSSAGFVTPSTSCSTGFGYFPPSSSAGFVTPSTSCSTGFGYFPPSSSAGFVTPSTSCSTGFGSSFAFSSLAQKIPNSSSAPVYLQLYILKPSLLFRNRKSLRENFVSYKLVVETVSQVRALLLGPVGSGKSSLINSIRSTMFKRIMHLPNVGTAAGSFTKKLKSYDIRVEKGGPPTALSLCDVMAIGDEDFTGLSLSDTRAVIKGHVPEGYQFQSDVPISDKISGYRAAPTLEDQVHGVLFVLDASKVTSYSTSLRNNLRKLHTTASDMGIPQLILLTHVDLGLVKLGLCVCTPVSNENNSSVCIVVMQTPVCLVISLQMQKAAELVGLPLSYVVPVKNYMSELSVDRNTDILLLSAVNSILQAVDDALEDQYPGGITVQHTQTTPNSSIGVAEL
uniref:TLDc domain-containing protein n=1 Tax=Astyanax mexicanus TaxID=7994 RepID=A0A3B1KLC8_ASTMX